MAHDARRSLVQGDRWFAAAPCGSSAPHDPTRHDVPLDPAPHDVSPHDASPRAVSPHDASSKVSSPHVAPPYGASLEDSSLHDPSSLEPSRTEQDSADRVTVDWSAGTLRITAVDQWAEPLRATFAPDCCPKITVTLVTTRVGQVRGSGSNLRVRRGEERPGLALGWQNGYDGTGVLNAYAGSPMEHYTTWTVTITDSSTGAPVPVEGLAFSIGEIDYGHAPSSTCAPPGIDPLYDRENVVLTPMPPVRPQRGGNVIGSGINADPWVSTYYNHEAWLALEACESCGQAERNALWNSIYDARTAPTEASAVRIDYGPTLTSTFTLKAWNANPRVDSQEITLSGLTFLRPCPGAGRPGH